MDSLPPSSGAAATTGRLLDIFCPPTEPPPPKPHSQHPPQPENPGDTTDRGGGHGFGVPPRCREAVVPGLVLAERFPPVPRALPPPTKQQQLKTSSGSCFPVCPVSPSPGRPRREFCWWEGGAGAVLIPRGPRSGRWAQSGSAGPRWVARPQKRDPKSETPTFRGAGVQR